MTIRATQRPGPRSVAAMVGLALVVGCAEQKAAEKPAFSYDPAEFLGAKPWTDLA